ncbi:hypothetical protein QYH69_32360 [Paraburkholderia sp. SARCC-3016]|uniref:hypothetical protein n=1 Tax=Paraburkholderia sp. SARCC-3016 TaxID=3058611 RepID=UPI00280669FD|nr:hypothetical protein [Paraburkholderia sp. SARCC-3016]MDQ7981918.1 hypothetical protein [Paraburkholderia sp. SARCC-3016]
MSTALEKVAKALREKKEADALVRIRAFPYHQAKGNYDRAVEAQKTAERALVDALTAVGQSVEIDGVVYRATHNPSSGAKGFEAVRPLKVGNA